MAPLNIPKTIILDTSSLMKEFKKQAFEDGRQDYMANEIVHSIINAISDRGQAENNLREFVAEIEYGEHMLQHNFDKEMSPHVLKLGLGILEQVRILDPYLDDKLFYEFDLFKNDESGATDIILTLT